MKLLLIIMFCLTFVTVFKLPSVQVVSTQSHLISVTVKGEVETVKVIEIDKDSKIKDILEKISLTDQADVSQLDVNQRLIHNMIITIPKQSEGLKCISINSASKDELMSLPGIGEQIALLIVEYRQTKPFLFFEDLLLVKGIGKNKFEKIRDKICL